MKLFKGKKKKGFTLVELMVVVGIIALLLLLVVPRLAGNTEKAKTRTFESNYRTLASDITVAYVSDTKTADLGKIKTKAETTLKGKPEGATYVLDTTNEQAVLVATLGTYKLTFNVTEGTTKAEGTAPGSSFVAATSGP